MKGTMRRFMKSRLVLVALGVVAVIGVACTKTTTSASDAAQAANQRLQSQIYQVHNNVEFNNYNRRQAIADDPTTILWCTAYLQNPNVPPITYPIVGKLTSSNKRPYATAQVIYQNDYNPELVGPDHMYGASSEYRYGFTPGGVYVDFTNVPTVCTTQPTIYQATQTTVVLKVDSQLNAVADEARSLLKQGQQANGTISAAAGAQAQQLLEGALGAAAK